MPLSAVICHGLSSALLYGGLTRPAYSLKMCRSLGYGLRLKSESSNTQPQFEAPAKRGLAYPRGLPKRSADTT